MFIKYYHMVCSIDMKQVAQPAMIKFQNEKLKSEFKDTQSRVANSTACGLI